MKEHFLYSDYAILVKRESQIVPGKYQSEEVIAIGCPRCHHLNNPIDHGQKIFCRNCSLSMMRLGNGLTIEAEVPEKQLNFGQGIMSSIQIRGHGSV